MYVYVYMYMYIYIPQECLIFFLEKKFQLLSTREGEICRLKNACVAVNCF